LALDLDLVAIVEGHGVAVHDQLVGLDDVRDVLGLGEDVLTLGAE
jgi:hypothetical protein